MGKLFLTLLLVIGTITGAVVVAIVTVKSKADGKALRSAMDRLGITFAPLTSRSFWNKRTTDNTTLRSRIPEVWASLSGFEGTPPEEKLEAELAKRTRKQQAVERGTATVNGIEWSYAIPTYKVEGGNLVRSLMAVTGNSGAGLMLSATLGRAGTIPDENVEDLLSGLARKEA